MSQFSIEFQAATPYARLVGDDGHVTFDTREGLFQPRTEITGTLDLATRTPVLFPPTNTVNTVTYFDIGTAPAGADFMIGYFTCSWGPGNPLEPYGVTPPERFVTPVGGSYMPVYRSGAASGSAGPTHVASYSIVMQSGLVRIEERLNLITLVSGSPYNGPSIYYLVYVGAFV